jgi:hypothetical protein
MSEFPAGPGSPSSETGLPMSKGLRTMLGLGFLAVGIVQGVGILTGEGVTGTVAIMEGLGFFLLACTGVTMLLDRSYSLYLLLVWAILGIAGAVLIEGALVIPALIARIMVGIVALAALAQRGAHLRASGP